MKALFRPFKQLLVRLSVALIARLLKIPGVYHRQHFATWEAQGYHITPVHFYQPIPDTRELAQNYPKRTALTGVDLQPEAQVDLLRSLSQYAAETKVFPAKTDKPDAFYLDNGLFVGIDPHVYYSLIRHFKPGKIIEIGAGFSTLVAAQAVSQQSGTQLIAVEPYPRDFIKRGMYGIQHIGQKAEDLGVEYFDQLHAGDFLFIDTSHVVKTGGDVNYLILEVLPRLKSGVIVHIHDIFLPYEYPREWLLHNHWFWTEQYLVQAYLTHNPRVEILLANHWLEQEHSADLRQAFPDALKWTGGSLWLRVK